MNLPNSYYKGPHPLLCDGSEAARGTKTASFTANHLSARLIFILYQTAVGILLALTVLMTWLRALTWSYSGHQTEWQYILFAGKELRLSWCLGLDPKKVSRIVDGLCEIGINDWLECQGCNLF